MALGYHLIKFSTLTIHRPTQGVYVAGIWQPGTESTFDIKAKVQPLKPNEVMILPESLRSRAWIKIFVQEDPSQTLPAIRCAQQGPNGYGADTLSWQGYKYEVMKDMNYNDSVLDHTYVLAARVEVSAGAS